MKKTIVTLLALGSVAVADDYTFSSYYTEGETDYSIDTFVGKTPTVNTPQATRQGDITVELNAGEMYSSTLPAEGTLLTLDSLSVLNYGSKNIGAGSTVSITIGGTTYTSNVASSNAQDSVYNLITYTFDGCPTFAIEDDLTFTISILQGASLGFGLTGKTLQGTDNVYESTFTTYQGAFQIKASTAPVPEPTTATLSLLALAGLAARRRRK